MKALSIRRQAITVLGFAFAALLFATVQTASAASTLFGDAQEVNVGNPANAIQIRSDVGIAPGFGGVRFNDASGLLYPALVTLSADYNVTDDNCGGGSPRFQIQIDTDNDNISNGNVFVAIGPSPAFTGCALGWQSTGNVIGNADAGRYDYGQFGGSAFTTYANAPASVLAGEVLNISIVVDGSWNAAASGGVAGEQTVLIDNVVINNALYDFPPPPPVTVTIHKYIDGVHADVANAEAQSFPMASCWDADNIGAGCGAYALAAATYDAQTSSMSSGADYSTNEVLTDPSVGASCEEGKPFALVGYTIGGTELLAQGGILSTTSPAFINITTDQHVIVWNEDCTPKLTLDKIVVNNNNGTESESAWTLSAAGPTPISGPGAAGSTDVESDQTFQAGTYTLSEVGPVGYTASAWSCVGGDQVGNEITIENGETVVCTITNDDNVPEDVTVTIVKFIDGVHATAVNANNASFPMVSNWDAVNLGGVGNGSYPLSTVGYNTANAYEAVTSDMTNGSDYATSEVTSQAVVGASCADGKPFALVGYTTGNTLAEAQLAIPSLTSPSFTDITTDKYVIVWNQKCVTPPTPPTCSCCGGSSSNSVTVVNGISIVVNQSGCINNTTSSSASTGGNTAGGSRGGRGGRGGDVEANTNGGSSTGNNGGSTAGNGGAGGAGGAGGFVQSGPASSSASSSNRLNFSRIRINF